MRPIVAAIFATVCLSNTVQAGPLSEARVTKIINEVSVVDPATGSRKAELQQVIKEELGLKTGIKSRSELVFQDNTLTRIGPESYFSFKAGTRDMSLEKGTMLLQVPKGLGGAKIRTAAVTAAITGTTIMMEYRPKQSIKVLVLEGSLRLSVNGKLGEALTLRPGQMVMMPADAKRIPAPVDVDLAQVMKTSSLVNMSGGAAALPSAALIRQEIAAQAKAKDDRTLAATNLVVNGAGTDVRVISEPMMQTISRRNDPAMPTSSVQPPTAGNTPAPTAAGTTNPPTTGGSSAGGTTGGNTGTGNGNTGNGNNGNGNNGNTGNGNNGNGSNGNNGNNGNHGNGNNGNGNGNNGNGNGPGGNGNGNGNNGNGNGNNGDNGNHGNGNNGNGNGNNGNGNGPGGNGNGPGGDDNGDRPSAETFAVLPLTNTDEILSLLEGAVPSKTGSVVVQAPNRSASNVNPSTTGVREIGLGAAALRRERSGNTSRGSGGNLLD
jgi:hypothetical protein